MYADAPVSPSFLLLLILAAALPFPAGAAELASPSEERVTVRVEGRAIFRVGPAADADARTRAARIERRVEALLEKPEAIAPVRIEPAEDDPTTRILSVAGVPIVTVTVDDAQENLTTVDALARQWATALDRALQRSRELRQTGWGRFRTQVQGSVEAAFSRLGESAIIIIPRALAALLVLGLFWLIAASLRAIVRAIFHRVSTDRTLENLVKQVVYYAVWILGIIVAVDALGWDPQAMATALGLTGLALGFALRDVLSNFVSGLLLLVSRPFEVGDQIVVGETEGGVERIMLRATQLRTYDGRVVLVPNAEIFTSRITNNTAHPVRRGSVGLCLDYAEDLERASDVIRRAAARTENVLPDPLPTIRIQELGSENVLLEVRFWTDSRRSDFVATRSAVRGNVIEAMKQAGIRLPEPSVRMLTPYDAARWRKALGGEPNAGMDDPPPAAGPESTGR